MSFLKLLYERWKAESPLIFQRFANFGVSLTFAGATALAPGIVPGWHPPAFLATIGGYMVSVGISIGIISKLTCKNPPDQTPKT